MKRRGLLAGLIAAVSAVALGCSAAGAADRADIFTVTVPVDATAANADAARDAARNAGEHGAYDALMNRLTLARDRARLPPATDSLLDELIQGFEVANERRSTVRYLADYTFRFNAAAVEQLLRGDGVPFADTPSKPLIVLAVLETPAGPVLWDDPNPWRDTWSAASLPQGLVPFAVPLGEVEDVTAIDAANAESGDDAHLKAIAANYGNGDVLVTRATPKNANGAPSIDVASTRFDPGNPGGEQSWVASYPGTAGESEADLYAAAVAGTAAQIQEAWKAANIIDYSQTGTLVASVPATDLKSWLAVRNRLDGIASIQRTDLVSLDRQHAVVALHYVGDATQLREALAQSNLTLEGNDPDWVLHVAGAAPSPPPENAPPPDAGAAPSPPPEDAAPPADSGQ